MILFNSTPELILAGKIHLQFYNKRPIKKVLFFFSLTLKVSSLDLAAFLITYVTFLCLK